MQQANFNSLFETYCESSLIDRYLPLSKLEPLIVNLPKTIKVEVLGHSVENRPIYALELGSGPKKILMWSQMHGNESTTTKAVVDVLQTFSSEHSIADEVLTNCTLKIVPMLNPDGAEVYTRVNANQVDLNRDAQALTQPESRLLQSLFTSFKPDFCFNLHGQRTIFSAGKTANPATVSFLAPAQDSERNITATRQKAMEVIVAMNSVLQGQIPNQVGVYDDAFNLNCVGDTFQSLEVPTILFEAGHFKNDYNRNFSRKFIYNALMAAISYISKNEVTGTDYHEYLKIPSNEKCFLDIIIKNTDDTMQSIGIQYQERLSSGCIVFIPKVEQIDALDGLYAHKMIDAQGSAVFKSDATKVQVGDEIDFVIINNEKYSLKIENT